MQRIPKSQLTIDGSTLYEARKSYSLSLLHGMSEVYCVFCFHRGKVEDFAVIALDGEIEHLFRCPECKVRMTRGTLLNSFTPEQLGYFIGYYDRFWGRVLDHNKWTQRFNQMFTYSQRQEFWKAYYEARPKKEERASDNALYDS